MAAQVIITLKVMPTGPEVNLEQLKKAVAPLITKFGGHIHKEEIEPVGFGLKAINFLFIADESKGGTDNLEADIAKVKHVESVQITDVRRAIG